MKTFHKNPLVTLFLGLFVIQMSACDFQAAEDAFDDFDIIIGLDPINTIVNAIVYDNASGDLLEARLSFSGPGASLLIDAYSDPLGTSKNMEDGLMSFGLNNSIQPSKSNPFMFAVSVESDGYYNQTKSISVVESGSVAFEVAMVREVDMTSIILGTAATQDNSVQTDQSGVVQQTVTVQTQASTSTQAQATVIIPAGTIPVTQSGQPLQGSIQTQVRVYDPGAGQSNLPSGATTSDDGTNQGIIAGVFFQMTDSNGNVAADFQSSTGKAGKSGICTNAGGLFEIDLAITNPNIVLAYNTLVSAGTPPTTDIFGFTPADGQNNLLGSSPLALVDANTVSASICIGGSLGNVATGNLGNMDQGVFFTLVFPASFGSTGLLSRDISINNLGGSASAVVNFEGPGVYGSRTLTVPAGITSKSIANWLQLNDTYFILSGSNYSFTVTLEDGTVQSDVSGDPTSGSGSITLPATTGLQSYNISASLTCPPGQEFEVQLTSESLDPVSVFYRRNQAGVLWNSIPDAAITQKEASSTSIDVAATLSLLPSTSYSFRGVLDDNSAEQTETTPSSGGSWTISMNVDDVGIECVAQ